MEKEEKNKPNRKTPINRNPEKKKKKVKRAYPLKAEFGIFSSHADKLW